MADKPFREWDIDTRLSASEMNRLFEIVERFSRMSVAAPLRMDMDSTGVQLSLDTEDPDIAANTALKPNLRIYTTSATWTKPDNLVYLEVEVQGGGGAAGTSSVDGTATHTATAGGGGAGGYAYGMIQAADLDDTEAVTVGGGGASNPSSSGGAGGAGGDSSFGTLCRAQGGCGGDFGAGDTSVGLVSGGQGGRGTDGDILQSGEDGGYGFSSGALSPGSPTGNLPVGGYGGSSAFGGGRIYQGRPCGKDGDGTLQSIGYGQGSPGINIPYRTSAIAAQPSDGIPGVVILREWLTVDLSGAGGPGPGPPGAITDTFLRLNTRYFTTSGTWIKPANLVFAEITVVGGGGAGGYTPADTTPWIASGGAGGGSSYRNVPAASLGSTETVTVGTGGVGTTSTAPSGGTSSFGVWCSATGGQGGGAASGVASPTTATGFWYGGYGGMGSGGDINTNGGDGEWGIQFPSGNTTNVLKPGTGGESILSGRSGFSNVGANARGNGGGGAGAPWVSGVAKPGWNGSPGLVIVKEWLRVTT